MLLIQWVRSNYRVVVGLMAAILLFSMVSFFTASANEGQAANTLRISPVRSDITVEPGGSETVSVTISNLTDSPMTLRPVHNDFIAGDERGTPALILDEDEFAPTHSLKRFMEPIGNITIPAEESQTVEVVINVPEDAQAGGYFGAVRFAPASADDGGQVNMSTSAASLILLTVPGDVVEKLELTEFKVQQNGNASTFFNSSDDIQATFRFESKSNVQVAPFGKITLQRGDRVVYEADFNSNNPRDMILPDSARRWDVPLNDIGSFGRYTVTATLTYGEQNQSVEVEESFWVVPWIAIVAIAAGVLLLIGLVVGGWLFLRSYKNRILKSGGGSRAF